MKRLVSSLAMILAMLLVAPSAFAAITTYRATMSGPAEATPNPSPGTGIATIIIDDVTLTMSLSVPFYDLLGTTTAAHIHCCTLSPLTGTAPVATRTPTFPGFPTDVRSGLYQANFSLADPATFNQGFISANGGTVDLARAALLDGINANSAYLNLHSSRYPGGEIRGFLVEIPGPVPEPGSWAMLAVGLGAVGYMARKKRR